MGAAKITMIVFILAHLIALLLSLSLLQGVGLGAVWHCDRSFIGQEHDIGFQPSTLQQHACLFYYKYLSFAVWFLAFVPGIFLPFPLNIYLLYIVNPLFYGAVGYILGLLVSLIPRVFRQRSSIA